MKNLKLNNMVAVIEIEGVDYYITDQKEADELIKDGCTFKKLLSNGEYAEKVTVLFNNLKKTGKFAFWGMDEVIIGMIKGEGCITITESGLSRQGYQKYKVIITDKNFSSFIFSVSNEIVAEDIKLQEFSIFSAYWSKMESSIRKLAPSYYKNNRIELNQVWESIDSVIKSSNLKINII